MTPADASHLNRLVLVVEDEASLADILVAYLQRDGLRTLHADNGMTALQNFRQNRPDIVLLDIRLPGIDGIDVLKTIRAESDTPVIMVTAMADDVDKLVSLRMGADDYVVKPFNPAEVVARVRAVLRRTAAAGPQRPATLRVGRLEIDRAAHAATVHDEDGAIRPLPLTLTEYKLLETLASQPRRCFTRSDLVEACLPESDALDRVIDSHLSKLRRKLEVCGCGDMINTVRGIGYRLWPES